MFLSLGDRYTKSSYFVRISAKASLKLGPLSSTALYCAHERSSQYRTLMSWMQITYTRTISLRSALTLPLVYSQTPPHKLSLTFRLARQTLCIHFSSPECPDYLNKPPRGRRPNQLWRRQQITKPDIIPFSSVTCYFSTRRLYSQSTGLKFKEGTSKVPYLEHSVVWCWKLATSSIRSEIPGKFWNVVLQDGEDQ